MRTTGIGHAKPLQSNVLSAVKFDCTDMLSTSYILVENVIDQLYTYTPMGIMICT
ncbi:hypothetical protein EMIT07CA2_160044 [Brevibacillus sp. IT-7CA2]